VSEEGGPKKKDDDQNMTKFSISLTGAGCGQVLKALPLLKGGLSSVGGPRVSIGATSQFSGHRSDLLDQADFRSRGLKSRRRTQNKRDWASSRGVDGHTKGEGGVAQTCQSFRGTDYHESFAFRGYLVRSEPEGSGEDLRATLIVEKDCERRERCILTSS